MAAPGPCTGEDYTGRAVHRTLQCTGHADRPSVSRNGGCPRAAAVRQTCGVPLTSGALFVQEVCRPYSCTQPGVSCPRGHAGGHDRAPAAGALRFTATPGALRHGCEQTIELAQVGIAASGQVTDAGKEVSVATAVAAQAPPRPGSGSRRRPLRLALERGGLAGLQRPHRRLLRTEVF